MDNEINKEPGFILTFTGILNACRKQMHPEDIIDVISVKVLPKANNYLVFGNETIDNVATFIVNSFSPVARLQCFGTPNLETKESAVKYIINRCRIRANDASYESMKYITRNYDFNGAEFIPK